MSKMSRKSTKGCVWGYCECKKKHVNNWRSCITPYYKQVICLECFHSWYTKKPYVNALQRYDLLDELCLKEGTKLSERNLKIKDLRMENKDGFIKSLLSARKGDYKIRAWESDEPGNVKFSVEVNINSDEYKTIYKIYNFSVKQWLTEIENVNRKTGNSIIKVDEMDQNFEDKTKYLLSMGYEYKSMIVHGESDNRAYNEFVKPFYLTEGCRVFGQFGKDISINILNGLEVHPYDPNVEPKSPYAIRRFEHGEWVIMTQELYGGLVTFRPLGEDTEMQVEPSMFSKFSLSPCSIPDKSYFRDFNRTLNSVIVGEAFATYQWSTSHSENCFIIENEHGLRTLFNSFGASVLEAFDSVEKAIIWKKE